MTPDNEVSTTASRPHRPQNGMPRPCNLCGVSILDVRNGSTGMLMCLDADSREHVFELSDSSETLVAHPAKRQEVFVDHPFTCRARGVR